MNSLESLKNRACDFVLRHGLTKKQINLFQGKKLEDVRMILDLMHSRKLESLQKNKVKEEDSKNEPQQFSESELSTLSKLICEETDIGLLKSKLKEEGMDLSKPIFCYVREDKLQGARYARTNLAKSFLEKKKVEAARKLIELGLPLEDFIIACKELDHKNNKIKAWLKKSDFVKTNYEDSKIQSVLDRWESIKNSRLELYHPRFDTEYQDDFLRKVHEYEQELYPDFQFASDIYYKKDKFFNHSPSSVFEKGLFSGEDLNKAKINNSKILICGAGKNILARSLVHMGIKPKNILATDVIDTYKKEYKYKEEKQEKDIPFQKLNIAHQDSWNEIPKFDYILLPMCLADSINKSGIIDRDNMINDLLISTILGSAVKHLNPGGSLRSVSITPSDEATFKGRFEFMNSDISIDKMESDKGLIYLSKKAA